MFFFSFNYSLNFFQVVKKGFWLYWFWEEEQKEVSSGPEAAGGTEPPATV